ncbi:MAG: hypothetical protein WD226_00660 [Planctomycetota bacterium]
MIGSFGALDWIVMVGALLAVTLIGERLAGRAKTERDFFLGGRSLPWWAVSASIVATEISAVTFVSFPSVVWRAGGDLTYLQIGLVGSGIARLVIGYVLVPAYFEREIYSPYEYMGAHLGQGARRAATVLFTLGGVLGQASRVYLIAVVLEVLLLPELLFVESASGLPPLVTAVAAIALVATLWTWLGGIRTVIWTDALLFGLFLVGIGATLLHAHAYLPGGLDDALSRGWQAGKLRVFDFEPTFAKPYTFWAALFAASWSSIGFYGTDQLLAQRLFCCRDARAARRAIVTSLLAVGVIALVGVMGIALWRWTELEPLQGEAARLVAEKPDRIFPVHILTNLPDGLRGLVVAGAFAAAISSLDSILAALAQTSLTVFVRPVFGERPFLLTTRLLILFWALVLSTVAIALDRVAEHYASLLDLALAMASYTGGALIAGFFLAFWRRDAGGFVWAAPLSVLAVYTIAWPVPIAGDASWLVVGGALAVVVGAWCWLRLVPAARAGQLAAEVAPTAALLVACLGLAWLVSFGVVEYDGDPHRIAWPWYVPLGSTVAFVLAQALRPRWSLSPVLSPVLSS